VRVGDHVVELHDNLAPAWCSAWPVVVVDTVTTLCVGWLASAG
jgi:hypothetical protein